MSIRKHFPSRTKDAYKNLQVKMETALVEEVKFHMKIDDISWNELLTACFVEYLEESKMAHTGDVESNRRNNKVTSALVGIVTVATFVQYPLLQYAQDFSDYLI